MEVWPKRAVRNQCWLGQELLNKVSQFWVLNKNKWAHISHGRKLSMLWASSVSHLLFLLSLRARTTQIQTNKQVLRGRFLQPGSDGAGVAADPCSGCPWKTSFLSWGGPAGENKGRTPPAGFPSDSHLPLAIFFFFMLQVCSPNRDMQEFFQVITCIKNDQRIPHG